MYLHRSRNRIYILLFYVGYTECEKGRTIKIGRVAEGNYITNIYHGTGGATVDFSTIVEIEKKDSEKKKIIYFQYHCENVKLKWISEEEVEIDHKKMNIFRDVCDYRH